VAGYRDAFNALGKYVQLRAKDVTGPGTLRDKLMLGAHNRQRKAELWRQAANKADDPFDVVEAAGVGEEALEILDITARMEASQVRTGPLDFIGDVGELFMKLFEKAEVMNRLVTARAVMNKAKREGTLLTQPLKIQQQTRKTVELTQFGATLGNTPMVFLDKVSGRNGLQLLTHPMLRQFLTFPLRMTTMMAHTSPKMAVQRNGEILYPELSFRGAGAAGRVVAGQGSAADAKAAMQFAASMRDWTKAMAIGAVTYSVGKEMFGVDLGGATVLGGTYVGAMRPEGPLGFIPASPAVSLALAPAVWAFTGKDYQEAFRFALPTLVPGGVSMSRALGIAPDLPLGPFSPIQRTHVDWSRRTADGKYPIFTADGRLISYETRAALAARAAGVDFSSYRDEGEFIGYMQNIREETVKQRADAIRALITGDLLGAQKITNGYQEKYGHRLMVNERQIDQFIQNQNRTRIERALEGMPSQLKGAFTHTAATEFGHRLGMDPAKFAEATTAKQRAPHRSGTIELSDEVRKQVQESLQVLHKMAAEKGIEPKTTRPDPLTPFGTYQAY
jgi:hypothetical protein